MITHEAPLDERSIAVAWQSFRHELDHEVYGGRGEPELGAAYRSAFWQRHATTDFQSNAQLLKAWCDFSMFTRCVCELVDIESTECPHAKVVLYWFAEFTARRVGCTPWSALQGYRSWTRRRLAELN